MNKALFELIFSVSHRNPFLDGALVLAARYLPYILVIGIGLIVFAQFPDWRRRLLFFVILGLAVLMGRGFMTEGIRFFYPYQRPNLALDIEPLIGASSSSFPSGHASMFFAITTVLFYFNRRWSAWYFALAAVNGIGRIAVGVHWPLDIMGGAAVGILSGILVYRLIEPYLKEIELKSSS